MLPSMDLAMVAAESFLPEANQVNENVLIDLNQNQNQKQQQGQSQNQSQK